MMFASIMRFSKTNSAGRLLFAAMPPTFAAARKDHLRLFPHYTGFDIGLASHIDRVAADRQDVHLLRGQPAHQRRADHSTMKGYSDAFAASSEGFSATRGPNRFGQSGHYVYWGGLYDGALRQLDSTGMARTRLHQA